MIWLSANLPKPTTAYPTRSCGGSGNGFWICGIGRPVILAGGIAAFCACADAWEDDALSRDPATGAATSPVPAICRKRRRAGLGESVVRGEINPDMESLRRFGAD